LDKIYFEGYILGIIFVFLYKRVMWYKISSMFLFMLPPELAHKVSLQFLKSFPIFKTEIFDDPIEIMGLFFKNRISLGAGFDKNADYIDALGSLGFGSIEVGALTPLAQDGNKKPRLFRKTREQAIINRMGFNNKGILYAIQKIKQRKYNGIVGVNIGKNKDTPLENAIDDYLYCLQVSYRMCDYISINISSPNTKGLRDLLKPVNLEKLLERLKKEQLKLFSQTKQWTPLVVKISPDMEKEQLLSVANIIRKTKMDGVIATNTTIQHGFSQQGGLSGLPLNAKSTQIIKILRDLYQGDLPIIASGGIMNAEIAQEKIAAGASLVQIYSGLIYQGPKIVRDIFNAIKHSKS
jgi:dihydroorotate dehydrogenase